MKVFVLNGWAASEHAWDLCAFPRDRVFSYVEQLNGLPEKAVEAEGEIDLIIQGNGVLYPIEIKMSTMPKASMASEFDVLDGIPDKKRGTGAIICLIDRKLYLRENLVALPLEYL